MIPGAHHFSHVKDHTDATAAAVTVTYNEPMLSKLLYHNHLLFVNFTIVASNFPVSNKITNTLYRQNVVCRYRQRKIANQKYQKYDFLIRRCLDVLCFSLKIFLKVVNHRLVGVPQVQVYRC